MYLSTKPPIHAPFTPPMMNTMTHIHTAVALYTRNVGASPPDEADCRTLYGTLAAHDNTVLKELTRKLTGPRSDALRDPESARTMANTILQNCNKLPATLPKSLGTIFSS